VEVPSEGPGQITRLEQLPVSSLADRSRRSCAGGLGAAASEKAVAEMFAGASEIPGQILSATAIVRKSPVQRRGHGLAVVDALGAPSGANRTKSSIPGIGAGQIAIQLENEGIGATKVLVEVWSWRPMFREDAPDDDVELTGGGDGPCPLEGTGQLLGEGTIKRGGRLRRVHTGSTLRLRMSTPGSFRWMSWTASRSPTIVNR
jgi:hypothetical protein